MASWTSSECAVQPSSQPMMDVKRLCWSALHAFCVVRVGVGDCPKKSNPGQFDKRSPTSSLFGCWFQGGNRGEGCDREG